jgi:hypothetical protein
MKPTRAEFKLSTGYVAIFGEDLEEDIVTGPCLILPVTDYDDAVEALDTLERSRARKKKDPQPAPVAAAPGASGTAGRGQGGALPPAPKCIVPGCEYDADTFAATDSDLCRDHASATADEKDAWRAAQENAKKPTPAPVAAKKARGIRQQLEGGAVETKAVTG